MKMRQLEKRFVNSPSHSMRVVTQAEERVRAIGPKPGQRLLDVGCGNGAAAIHLAQTIGLEAVGVDVDPKQIAAARSAAGDSTQVHLQVADATTLPFADGEFDLVYTNKTTHHIRDWEQAIAEMARVLKPGGHLLYADFAAPFGNRLPTRRGITTTTSTHQLDLRAQRSTLFHYSAHFQKRHEPAFRDSQR
jgi:ubiquinone/menaquinone biosynthesis C-methylase UbiE